MMLKGWKKGKNVGMRHGKVKTAKDDMKCQMLKVSLFPIVVFDFQGSRLLNFPHDHAQSTNNSV